jgi:hypothetical protein
VVTLRLVVEQFDAVVLETKRYPAHHAYEEPTDAVYDATAAESTEAVASVAPLSAQKST